VKLSGSVAALFVAVLIHTVAIGQQSAVLRSVDVYGTNLFSGDEVAREYKADVDAIAAAFATFPSNSELAGRSMQRIESALKSRAEFAYFNIGVTFSPPPDNGLYLMIDVVEKKDAARRMPFHAEPAKEQTDPGGLIAKWAEYQEKVFQLMFSGTPLLVTKCPVLHCLAPFDIPEFAPYLPIFNSGARLHEKDLYEIVKSDKNSDHRAMALFLLAHTNNAKKLLPVLGFAIHDPSDNVRNNAMRVMMTIAQSDPNREYPVKEVITALEFPSADDRNKSAYVLATLVKSRRYRDTINQQAVPALLKLLRLRQANNHDPAYEILKDLSGENFGDRDYTAWESWAAKRRTVHR